MRLCLTVLVQVALSNIRICSGSWKHENTIPINSRRTPRLNLGKEKVHFDQLDEKLEQAILKTEHILIAPGEKYNINPFVEILSFFGKEYVPVKVTKRLGTYEVLAAEVVPGPMLAPISASDLQRIEISIDEPLTKQPYAFSGVTEEVYRDLVNSGYYDVESDKPKWPKFKKKDVLSIRSKIYTRSGAKRGLYFRRLEHDVEIKLGGKNGALDDSPLSPTPAPWLRAVDIVDSSSKSRKKRRLVTLSEFNDFITVDEFRRIRKVETDVVYKRTWHENQIIQKAHEMVDNANGQVTKPRKHIRFEDDEKNRWQSFKKLMEGSTVRGLAKSRLGRLALNLFKRLQFKRNADAVAQAEDLLHIAIAGYEELARLHAAGVIMGQITKDSALIRYNAEYDRFEVEFRDFRAARRPRELPPALESDNKGNLHNIPWTREKDAFDWATVMQYVQGTHDAQMVKWREILLRTDEHFTRGTESSRLLNSWDRIRTNRLGRDDAIQSLFSQLVSDRSPVSDGPRGWAHTTTRLAKFLRAALKESRLSNANAVRFLPFRHRADAMQSLDADAVLEYASYLNADLRLKFSDADKHHMLNFWKKLQPHKKR